MRCCVGEMVKLPITLLPKLTASYWGGWVWSAHSGTDLLRLSHVIRSIWVKPWIQSGGDCANNRKRYKKKQWIVLSAKVYRFCKGRLCVWKSSRDLVPVYVRKWGHCELWLVGIKPQRQLGIYQSCRLKVRSDKSCKIVCIYFESDSERRIHNDLGIT